MVIKLYIKNEKDSLYLWDFLKKFCCKTVIKSDWWIKYGNSRISVPCQPTPFYAIIITRKTVEIKYKIKGGEIVVELDQFKVTLNSYAEPLVEVRDSL